MGEMIDLGTLDGNSHATAVNSKRQVVGYFSITDRTEPPFRHAFIWDGGQMFDLNTLIPSNSGLELVFADNINDRGEIVGVGVPDKCFPDFCGHLFLLIPCAGNDTRSCEDDAGAITDAPQNNPVLVTNSSTTSIQGRLTPNGIVAAWRTRMAQRYHISGLGTSPRD
jgi:probable HAF family extracellular repeat protein